MTHAYVACWDLDETLGDFTMIDFEMSHRQPPDYIRPHSLRYGIKETLERLSGEGYVHFIVSSAVSAYVNEALKRTSLRDYFEGILVRENHVVTIGGKYYQPVADVMKLSKDEVRSKMIVIGNAFGDRPADIPGLCFIEHKAGFLYDAIVTESIMSRLKEVGDGSFEDGFEKLYTAKSANQLQDEQPKINMGSGISFSLEKRRIDQFFKDAGVTPTVSDIEAEAYRTDLVIIEP